MFWKAAFFSSKEISSYLFDRCFVRVLANQKIYIALVQSSTPKVVGKLNTRPGHNGTCSSSRVGAGVDSCGCAGVAAHGGGGQKGSYIDGGPEPDLDASASGREGCPDLP